MLELYAVLRWSGQRAYQRGARTKMWLLCNPQKARQVYCDERMDCGASNELQEGRQWVSGVSAELKAIRNNHTRWFVFLNFAFRRCKSTVVRVVEYALHARCKCKSVG